MFTWLDEPGGQLYRMRLSIGLDKVEFGFIRPTEQGQWQICLANVYATGWHDFTVDAMKVAAQVMFARYLIQIADELLA